MKPTRTADVCLVLEGTYPYVAGGVSSWVHDLVCSLSELRFALLHIGAKAGTYGAPRYPLPDNVARLREVFCQGAERSRPLAPRKPGAPSRTLAALRRLHLESTVDDELLAGLAAADLSVDELLHGREAFDVIREIAFARAPAAPFLTLFWHFRSMHVALLRLLAEDVPVAGVYHSVSTGYAGALAAVASFRTRRPMLLTEHGIYARERDMELARASWEDTGGRVDPRIPRATSQLRELWSTFFARLSQIAYHQADKILTLSEVNRRKQLEDGAAPAKIEIIPNGVDIEAVAPAAPTPTTAPIRVGFVGRVVPIKDVITFIKACDLALREVPLDVEIIGPSDEDTVYASRCRALVAMLGRADAIRFVGPRKPAELYAGLDVCVLTSFSEGQPLVILEAHAAGVPVIASDVGACREMLEGGDADDRALGPSGIVTAVASAEQTAAALIALARSPFLRHQMGQAGRARVRARYTKGRMIASYRDQYAALAVGGR